jgi:hypothetical protein
VTGATLWIMSQCHQKFAEELKGNTIEALLGQEPHRRRRQS